MSVELENLAVNAIMRARPNDASHFKLVVREKLIFCVPVKQELPGDWPIIALGRYDLREGLSARQWQTVNERLRMAQKQGKL